MFPTGTPNYGANDMSLYPVLFAKHLVSYPARDVFASDSYHVAIGQRSARAAFSIGIPIFGDHVTNVIKGCAKKQVSGVDTVTIIAGVTHKVLTGINTVVKKIRHTVRGGLLMTIANHSVTASLLTPLPLPTPVVFRGCYEFPKRSLQRRFRAIVPVDISDVFSPHPSLFSGGACGNGGNLPATAHAQAGWIGRVKDYSLLSRTRAMMLAIAKRLSFYHVAILARYSSKVGLLTASAVAIAIWNFIGIGGILGHTDISLLDVGHVPGRYSVAGISTFHIVQPNALLCKDGIGQ